MNNIYKQQIKRITIYVTNILSYRSNAFFLLLVGVISRIILHHRRGNGNLEKTVIV